MACGDLGSALMATGCSNAPSGATPLPALLGLRVYQEGFVVDPAASLLGFAATHGAAGTIGS